MQRSIVAALALVFVSAVIVIQLFFPHAAGLADNGDFGKVIAREHFESSVANGADNFIYFVRSYRFHPGFYYNAGIPSSEIALFKLSAAVSRSVFAGSLDLRQHGLLHLIVFLAGLGLAARAATALPWRTFVPAVAASAIVFSDIAYTAYLNSFYMDAAAIIGLILCFGAGCYLVSPHRFGLPAVLAYGLGLLLLVSSKAQHAPLIVPGAAFLTFALWRPEVRRLRLPGALMIVAAAAGSVFVCTVSPREYSSKAIFNTVFYKLLPSSPDPAGDLDSLGLPQTT